MGMASGSGQRHLHSTASIFEHVRIRGYLYNMMSPKSNSDWGCPFIDTRWYSCTLVKAMAAEPQGSHMVSRRQPSRVLTNVGRYGRLQKGHVHGRDEAREWPTPDEVGKQRPAS